MPSPDAKKPHYTERHGAWCLHLEKLGCLNFNHRHCMKRFVKDNKTWPLQDVIGLPVREERDVNS